MAHLLKNTDSLNSLEAWIEAYKVLGRHIIDNPIEADELPTSPPPRGEASMNTTPKGDASNNARATDGTVREALTRRLTEASDLMLDQRASQLRDSDRYILSKLGVRGIGVIPFAKIWASQKLGMKFSSQTLNAFGLGGHNQSKRLRDNFQGASNSKTVAAKQAACILIEEGIARIVKDATFHTLSETVHATPVAGQIVGMGMDYYAMRSRMIRMIEAARKISGEVHQGLLVPQVVEMLMWVGSLSY